MGKEDALERKVFGIGENKFIENKGRKPMAITIVGVALKTTWNTYS